MVKVRIRVSYTSSLRRAVHKVRPPRARLDGALPTGREEQGLRLRRLLGRSLCRLLRLERLVRVRGWG